MRRRLVPLLAFALWPSFGAAEDAQPPPDCTAALGEAVRKVQSDQSDSAVIQEIREDLTRASSLVADGRHAECLDIVAAARNKLEASQSSGAIRMAPPVNPSEGARRP